MNLFRPLLALSILLALMGGLYGYLAVSGDGNARPPAAIEMQTAAARQPVVVTGKPGYTTESHATVRRQLANGRAVLLDVREQSEWDAGHLRAAVLIPLSVLRRELGSDSHAQQAAMKLPADKTIYCHCRSGRRVLPAAEILRAMGYDVRPLKDGYAALVEAGFETAGP